MIIRVTSSCEETDTKKNGLLHTRQKYIWDILSSVGLTDTNSVATPLKVNAKG